MRAILSPFRFSVHDFDIVERTKFCTKTASDAFIRGIKIVRFDDKLEEYRIDARRHKTIVEVVSRLCEFNTFSYVVNRRLNIRLCFCDYFLCLVRIGRVEQRNIVFGHNYADNAHIFEREFVAQLLDVFACVADFTAAVHNEPRFLFAVEFHLFEIIADNGRNSPRISRRHENEPVFCGYSRKIRSFNPVVQINDFISQSSSDFLCDILAVSRPRKIQYHFCVSFYSLLYCRFLHIYLLLNAFNLFVNFIILLRADCVYRNF